MSRDLTTIAAQEQEIRKRLKDLRRVLSDKREELRITLLNRQESIAASEREEAILLENISELETEAQEAFARARAIGKGDEVAAPPSVFGGFDSTPIPDAAVTEAFNTAITPQDQSDKTHIFGNGSF